MHTSAMVCLPLEEELQQLFQSISSIIANLYKLWIIIRRGNLNGDRLLKSSMVNVAFYETFDIGHVRNKFPSANDALVERLGKAISRRRQYLKYREQHHGKLSVLRQNTFTADQQVNQDRSLRFIETKASSRAQTPQYPSERGSGKTISHSIGVSTTASTYVLPKHQDVAEMDVDVYSESSSVSSCQSSTIGAERPRLPLIPQASERSRDFECPYCYTICRLVGTEGWQRKRDWKYVSENSCLGSVTDALSEDTSLRIFNHICAPTKIALNKEYCLKGGRSGSAMRHRYIGESGAAT